MLQALLIELLIRLFRYARASENISMRAGGLRKLAEYLDSHIQRKASVAAMARSGGVSKRTLLRKFKEQTGLSPMECLNQMRLSKACRLLRESPMEIKHIAIACGFPDSNYFSRQFRKSLGITPRRFRNAHVIGGA
jgi:transcriptional regulator GlxA family with amidase domain